MLGSLIVNHGGCKHHFFCMGWGIAFVFAVFASLAEIFLCVISLLQSYLLLLAYLSKALIKMIAITIS